MNKGFSFFNNQKGQSPAGISHDVRAQAALIDSIFFLMIVSAVCTSLFFFAINYGGRTESQLTSFYATDFATDALKVINYVNVLRTGESIYDTTAVGKNRNDYLLAMIKEDFAEGKGELSSQTKVAIARTLNSVLKPFDSSIDYAFYLFNESTSKFVFLMMAIHKQEPGDESANPLCTYNERGDFSVCREYYYCRPERKEVLSEQVFPYAGKVDTSHANVLLFEPDNPDPSSRNTSGLYYSMSLSVWVSRDLNVLNHLDDVTLTPDFNCEILALDVPAAPIP